MSKVEAMIIHYSENSFVFNSIKVKDKKGQHLFSTYLDGKATFSLATKFSLFYMNAKKNQHVVCEYVMVKPKLEA